MLALTLLLLPLKFYFPLTCLLAFTFFVLPLVLFLFALKVLLAGDFAIGTGGFLLRALVVLRFLLGSSVLLFGYLGWLFFVLLLFGLLYQAFGNLLLVLEVCRASIPSVCCMPGRNVLLFGLPLSLLYQALDTTVVEKENARTAG